jgi:hypothetical protein
MSNVNAEAPKAKVEVSSLRDGKDEQRYKVHNKGAIFETVFKEMVRSFKL